METKEKHTHAKKGSKWPYVVLGIIALIVLAGLVYIFYPKQAAEQNSAQMLDLTIVLMQRTIYDKGTVVYAGPIISKDYNLTISSNSTVGQLKGAVYKLTNLSVFEQTLMWKGVEMTNSKKTLSEYNVTNSSRIHVFIGYIN
jgi:hypothetical protein